MKILSLCLVALQTLAGVEGIVVHKHVAAKPAGAAAAFLQKKKNAGEPRMEIVNHHKEAGGGYKEGSPLHEKQEARKDEGMKSNLDAPEQPAIWQDPIKAAHKEPTTKELVVGNLVYGIFVLAFAGLYKYKMVTPLQARVKGDPPSDCPAVCRCGFAYACCDVSNLGTDWSICLWSLCCPLVQWAGTASKSVTPFMNFWPAVLLMLVLVALSPFTYGVTAVVAGIVMVVRRRQLRNVYNHTHPTYRSWFEDCCFIFCCDTFVCCRLVQEAREVEYTSPKLAEPREAMPEPPKQQQLHMDVPRSTASLPGTSPVYHTGGIYMPAAGAMQYGSAPFAAGAYSGSQTTYSNVGGAVL